MSLEKQPKVSIIMGVYNCEKTLDRCIDSILKQTYKNWELIMCDDCSKDNTLKLATQYSKKYKNIVAPILLLPSIKLWFLTIKYNKALALSSSVGYKSFPEKL